MRGRARLVRGPLGIVEADAALLRVLVENLIAKAVKFTRGRNPAIVEIARTERPGASVFMVRDNGAGFDMAYANKLFGVFQRLHRVEEFERTGIGLANVRRIIRYLSIPRRPAEEDDAAFAGTE